MNTYDGATTSRGRVAVQIAYTTGLPTGASSIAATKRVQSHLVRRHEVDAFHDVYLALKRPILTFRPEGWPDGAAIRKVDSVEDPHGTNVVEVLAFDADLRGGGDISEDIQQRYKVHGGVPSYASR